MRNVFLCSLIIFLTAGLFTTEASAGRFGGGRGFGAMRSNALFSRPYATQRPLQAASMARNNPSRLRGMMTGMLMGGLLASLFMGHGLTSALISWFFLGILVLLIVRLLQHKKHDRDM